MVFSRSMLEFAPNGTRHELNITAHMAFFHTKHDRIFFLYTSRVILTRPVDHKSLAAPRRPGCAACSCFCVYREKFYRPSLSSPAPHPIPNKRGSCRCRWCLLHEIPIPYRGQTEFVIPFFVFIHGMAQLFRLEHRLQALSMGFSRSSNHMLTVFIFEIWANNIQVDGYRWHR